METSQKVKLIREALKLSQSEFGRQTKFKQPHISAMESGTKPITLQFCTVVLKSYKVNINWLLNPDSNENMFIEKK